MWLPDNPLILSLLSAGLAFAALFAIFRPLELAFPAKAQRFFRPHFVTDLCYFLFQYLFFNGAVFWVLAHFAPFLRAGTPMAVQRAVADWPLWVQGVAVIVLSDVLIYWGHRLQHRVGFLWRFHAVHHSAEHLDWLAAHREHPLDSVYTILIVNLPAFAIGFPVEALAMFAAFRGLWAIFIHSNVKVKLPVLRTLIGSPELHHWHHDRDRDAGNYANLSPLMDLMFGTYRRPGYEPEAFGLREAFPKSYLGQLVHPFRWQRERPEASAGPVEPGLEPEHATRLLDREQ